jgi:hypothetical protein
VLDLFNIVETASAYRKRLALVRLLNRSHCAATALPMSGGTAAGKSRRNQILHRIAFFEQLTNGQVDFSLAEGIHRHALHDFP